MKIAIILIIALAMIGMTGSAGAVPDGYENIDATYENPNIVTTVDTFQHNYNWYQFRYYPPGYGTPVGDNDYPPLGDMYYTTDPFIPFYMGDPYIDEFDITGLPTGMYTVWLFKGGTEQSNVTNAITSARVNTTVETDIPEFATLAIPIVALLALVVLYRKKE